MKRIFQKGASALLALALAVSPALAASSFPDVAENAEYSEAVEYLKGTGIMCGDDKGNFNPDKTVTRAEMVTIICNMLGETENLAVSNKFYDVATTHWANRYIAKAIDLGFISGYGNGKFGPDDTVTYEQAITMLVRAMGQYSAADEAGGYPNGFIYVANERGYLIGISANKGDQMKRQQIATICYNIIMGGTET